MDGLNFTVLIAKPPRKNARPLSTCKTCAAVFKSSRNSKGWYCSNVCYGATLKTETKITQEFSKIYCGHCVSCSSAFVSRIKRAYCSDSCRPSYAAVYSTMKDEMHCRLCGVSYKPISTGGMPSLYCGDICRSEALISNKRKNRSIYKAKRRALMHGVSYETVSPYKVFDRDRWMCKLCGIHTPRKARGTFADNAPELDHINPISLGGSHTYINTQCACRRCNISKSNKPLGQTLLFG